MQRLNETAYGRSLGCRKCFIITSYYFWFHPLKKHEGRESEECRQEPVYVDIYLFLPWVLFFLRNLHKVLMKEILFSVSRRRMEVAYIGLNLRDWPREGARLSFIAFSTCPNGLEKMNLMAGSCYPTDYSPSCLYHSRWFWTIPGKNKALRNVTSGPHLKSQIEDLCIISHSGFRFQHYI